MLVAIGEVVACVVDDVIRTDGTDQIDLRGAAHAGDSCAESLGDLNCKSADSTGGADYQDALTRLHTSVIAHGLEGGRTGDADRCCLLESQVFRFGG